MSVDRCVCHDMLFSDLKRIAQERRLDFRGLAELTGCGENCGMCAPYIQKMLRSGKTSLPVCRGDNGCGSLGKIEPDADKRESA